MANSVLLVIALFAVHGMVYSLAQPAVDAHVASSSIAGARARIQGLYSAFGLVGGFVGASGTMIRISEARHSDAVGPGKRDVQQEASTTYREPV